MAQASQPFENKERASTADSAVWFSPSGLHLGTHVADHREDRGPRDTSAVDRMATLLALTLDKRLTSVQRERLAAAGFASRCGDHVSANIRLAHAGLSRIPRSHALPQRLAAATFLLDQGVSAEDLVNALGLSAPSPTLTKNDPNQPRVPAGHGRQSGEFGSGGGGAFSGASAAATAAVEVAPAGGAAPSFFASGVSAEALAALSTFALTLGGAAAVFGTLFVPTPNSTSTSGPLPGGDRLTYDYNRDEGVLRLRDANGNIVAGGPRDRSGIFHDADTGVAIGRDIGGALVFDQAAMVQATDEAGVAPRAKADAETDEESEPTLCPEATPEPNNRASERAKAYQMQISALVNPQRPLPYGLAVAFFDPKTGKWVRVDDCDEQDGALIEAKGPGFARNFKYEEFRESYATRFREQAKRQVQAAGARSVRWYFAERETADFAEELFRDTPGLSGIRVVHVEALVK